MDCPSELTCSMYADGELPAGETREVQIHLEGCAHCRDLVEALMLENRILVEAMQDSGEEFVPARGGVFESAPRQVARFSASVLCVAAGLRALFSFLDANQFPATFDWLNPLRFPVQVNLIISAIAYLAQEGASIMDSITHASILALAVLVLGATALLVRRLKITGAVLGVVAVTLALSLPGYALETRRSNQTIIVAAGETVDDTLIAAGDSVTVDGTINGDLLAFARRVLVRGTVKGSVISFAQSIDIEGTVEGSIFGFGQSVQARGRVVRNLYGFGQSVGVGSAGDIGGNVTAFGSDVLMEGAVARDVTTFAGVTDIRGRVGRNVVVRGDRVSVLAPARVGGELIAHVGKANKVQVQPGATVVGQTTVQIEKSRSRYRTASFYIGQLIRLGAAFVTGLLLFWLFPALAGVSMDSVKALLTAGGVGFLAIVATPVAAIILGITLIGLPIALISVVLWLAGLYLAKIIVAGFLGRSLLRGPMPLMLLGGLALIIVAVNLPYIGGIVNILLTLLGFGAIVLRLWRRTPAVAA